MTIIELYTLLLPLINVLGTICLVVLLAGGTLYLVSWIVSRFWKQILTISAISLGIGIAILYFGAA